MTEKKTTDAQYRALKKYKSKVKRITVDFPPTDAELWEHIQNQPNKQGYIKSLIRADMAIPNQRRKCVENANYMGNPNPDGLFKKRKERGGENG